MAKLRILFLTLTICLSTMFCLAQISKSEADDLVMNQLLQNELSNIDVFSIPDIQLNSFVTLYDLSIFNAPYPEYWLYFIDDVPFANWNHPSRYVFVKTDDGSITTINSNLYPVDWHTNYSPISMATRPEPVEFQPLENIDVTGLPPNPHLYAVIISGADDQRYWGDASAIYNTLIQVYGYMKENIFVHYGNGTSTMGGDLDGPPNSNEIDYPASKYLIHQTFQELAGETNIIQQIPELGVDDQLFVFITDHGGTYQGHSYIYLPNSLPPEDRLYDNELADYVMNINCSQMIYVMEQCNSGGFVDYIMNYNSYPVACKNRSIHTAASASELSNWEVYLSGGLFDEFVLYWTAAARKGYPRKTQPWLTSSPTGSFPFQSFIPGHPDDYDPDLNNDNFVQMEEAFAYANNMDTWSPVGYYNPYTPNTIENPVNVNNIGLTADLLTLAGYAGRINTSQITEPRHYIAGGNIEIVPPGSLTLSTNTNFNLGYNGFEILVQPSTSFVLQDNTILSGSSDNTVQVNGNIQVGQNVIFENNSNASFFGGLVLNKTVLQTTLGNTTFNRTGLLNYGADLIMHNCLVNDCQSINSFEGNVTISNSVFYETTLRLENQSSNYYSTATVSGCTFSNPFIDKGIDLWNYGKYVISNNNIQASQTGISTNYSGNGNNRNQIIYNNNIYGCNSAGILAYNTIGSIDRNNIHNNGAGVKLMNNCNMALTGYGGADLYSQTQQIRDNSSYEVYASEFSFPWYFRYNAIIDEDNGGNPIDPMVLHDRPYVQPFLKLDVQYNCWGNNFNADQDLKTTNGIYKWYPTWCPGNDDKIPDEIEEMYLLAENKFENGLYSEAKNLFKLLVQLYPKSDYAQASMKELYRLEEFASSDYPDLKNYYQTNDSVISDTILLKLGNILANSCDVKLENWVEAINWYEDKITNPTCLQDSVFAIIDLGNLYFLMENQGLKSSYTGRLKHFKPETKEKYVQHRDYLLSLLPGDSQSRKIQDNLSILDYGRLLQNIPNPFSKSTQIWYKIDKQASVVISISNVAGTEIMRINEGLKDKGTYKVDFINSNLNPGLYFYTLVLDGKVSDTKKMSVVR